MFSTWFGPIMRVLETVDETGRTEFLHELNAILSRFNRSGDETLMVGAEYLEVVIDG